ncbi:MAG: hypothetical protein V1797_18080 [Pseudomonadota bacterium]
MKVVIVAGPPSAGKTAVILQTARLLQKEGVALAMLKFDTRSSADPERFAG